MKTRLLLACLVMLCIVLRAAAGQVSAYADSPPTPSAQTPAVPAPRPTTVGGGVNRPWTPPYMVALVATREPTSFAMAGISVAALMVIRRGSRRARALARV